MEPARVAHFQADCGASPLFTDHYKIFLQINIRVNAMAEMFTLFLRHHLDHKETSFA